MVTFYIKNRIYVILFIRIKRFRGNSQQDAQEFFRCFLDLLSMGEKKFLGEKNGMDIEELNPKKTIVENIFGGILCSHSKINLNTRLK